MTTKQAILYRALIYCHGLVAIWSLALIVFVGLLAPTALDPMLSLVVGLAGAVGAIYFLAIHRLLVKNHPIVSLLILTSIMIADTAALIGATGGIDSSYLALLCYILLVVASLGRWGTISWVTLVTTWYGYEFATRHFDGSFMVHHSGGLIVLFAAAVAFEWMYRSLGHLNEHKEDEVKKVVGQLTQEQLKNENLIQSVGEGVIVIDTNHRVQLFNPAAVRITGWDAALVQNVDYRTALNLHDQTRTKLAADFDPFGVTWQTGKSSLRSDLILETKNGHLLPISLLLSPIFNAQKQITGGIALFRDISTEKVLERQRSEFISTASHEMRTPVAAIEGYLSLAMNPMIATVDPRAKDYLGKAHTATQHLGELFRDLLSVTKLEDANLLGTLQVLDLTKLIQETINDMQFNAQKKHLELSFGLEDQVARAGKVLQPVYAVSGNPQRLREVIMNLIENALKFTSEGGVKVSLGGSKDTVTVSVADSGVGIASEDIPHLFQKFYRIDNTATRTIGGTGLGLYLCRNIIELLSGRIWVESTLGQGSTFKFSLPRRDASAIVAPTPGPAAHAMSPAVAPPKATPPLPTIPARKPIPVIVTHASNQAK